MRRLADRIADDDPGLARSGRAARIRGPPGPRRRHAHSCAQTPPVCRCHGGRAEGTRGIPVAGADRIRLAEQLATRDLMVLGDFLLLPEDDLALATVLKSPLFDLDDDDLIAIAPRRRGSLWSALLGASRNIPRLRPAAETLKRWRQRADLMPPSSFSSRCSIATACGRGCSTRLGPEAADPIDEFLSLALTYDDSAPPSLQGFIDWLRASDREIKRDMEHGRDEVRVMTVHGAKGLEAPIVFLPDTCTTGSGSRPGALLALEQHGATRRCAGAVRVAGQGLEAGSMP